MTNAKGYDIECSVNGRILTKSTTEQIRMIHGDSLVEYSVKGEYVTD